MGRGLGHLAAAHRRGLIKNGSQFKILKLPQILMKISKYSILNHTYFFLVENRVIKDSHSQLIGKFHCYHFFLNHP